MDNATFARPDLTTFARLDELGLEAVGQRLESGRKDPIDRGGRGRDSNIETGLRVSKDEPDGFGRSTSIDGSAGIMERLAVNTVAGRLDDLAQICPPGFRPPPVFIETLSGGLPDIDPWMWLLEFEGLAVRWLDIVRQQFPYRVLVPFAKHGGADDVYCFDGLDLTGDPPVFIIHTFTTPGWEFRGRFESYSDWLFELDAQHRDWLLEQEEDA